MTQPQQQCCTPGSLEVGDRVKDIDAGFAGTVDGQMSAAAYPVLWDDGHPYANNPTLAWVEDLVRE